MGCVCFQSFQNRHSWPVKNTVNKITYSPNIKVQYVKLILWNSKLISPFPLYPSGRLQVWAERLSPAAVFEIHFQSLVSFWMNSIQPHFQVHRAITACFLNGSTTLFPPVFWNTKHVFSPHFHICFSLNCCSFPKSKQTICQENMEKGTCTVDLVSWKKKKAMWHN